MEGENKIDNHNNLVDLEDRFVAANGDHSPMWYQLYNNIATAPTFVFNRMALDVYMHNQQTQQNQHTKENQEDEEHEPTKLTTHTTSDSRTSLSSRSQLSARIAHLAKECKRRFHVITRKVRSRGHAQFPFFPK